MTIEKPSAKVLALVLGVISLLGTISAYAKPFPSLDIATYCRTKEATDTLVGSAEQKYEKCLANESRNLTYLERDWSLLSEKQQEMCIEQDTHQGYRDIGFCAWETGQYNSRKIKQKDAR